MNSPFLNQQKVQQPEMKKPEQPDPVPFMNMDSILGKSQQQPLSETVQQMLVPLQLQTMANMETSRVNGEMFFDNNANIAMERIANVIKDGMEAGFIDEASINISTTKTYSD